MKRLIISILFITLTIIPLSKAWGDGDEVSELREEIMELKRVIREQQKQIEDLLREVNRIRSETKKEIKVAKREVITEAKKEIKLPEWVSRTKIGGKAYLQYRYELKDGSRDYNDFSIKRFYFTIKSRLRDRVSVRLTQEIRDQDSGYDFHLKYGYLTFKDYLLKGLNFYAGQIELPWVPYEEHLWGYRVQGTVFPDREHILTSSDRGIGISAKLLDGRIDTHLVLVNGEGWHEGERNKYKDFEGRITFKPFKGMGELEHLSFSIFGVTGHYDRGEPRDRFIAEAAFKKPGFLTLSAEYLRTRDARSRRAKREPSLSGIGGTAEGEGVGGFMVINSSIFGLDKRFELFGRVDYFDPDDDIGNNSHRRYIYGVAYKFNKRLKFLINNQREDFDQGANRKDTNTFFMQAELKY